MRSTASGRRSGARSVLAVSEAAVSHLALDEDPDAALEVITGKRRGSKAYAAVCLADAIRHGDYPAGWRRLDEKGKQS